MWWYAADKTSSRKLRDTTDAPEFLKMLLQSAEVLNAELSATKQGGYWHALRDLSLEAFQAASLEVMRNEAFFPAPVVFRQYARTWMTQQKALGAGKTEQQLLALREELLPQEEVKALIASVFKEWGGRHDDHDCHQ
jgi:hypothetical protein